MADICSDFERYLACSAEFAGIVSIRDVADEWADKRGIEIDHLMRRVIASADRWIHLVSMRTVDVESDSYAICHDLLNIHR